MLGPQTPFILHAAIETVAGLVFVLRPGSQVAAAETDMPARLVVQSLGGAILSSVLVALPFALRPAAGDTWDDTARHVSGAFAFWHLWPCYRAAVRIRTGAEEPDTVQTRTLGGPVVHLVTHVLFAAGFVWSALQ